MERGGALVPGVGEPHFGGQENVLTGQSTGGDGRAHALLVAVGLGGVDVAVADLEASSTARSVSSGGVRKTP